MKYCDFHADTLTEITKGNLYQNENDIDLKRAEYEFKQYIQIFAIWKDMGLVRETDSDFWNTYQQALAYLKREEQKIALCLSAEDMEQAFAQKKFAAFLAVEDCSYMGHHIEKIRQLGIRFAMLTWNYENQYGFGATVDQKRGLKKEGKELIKKLADQNIVLDVSHLSDAGIEDVFQMTDQPVIASHSNVRSVCDCPRNLPDESIKEIIRRKGIIGMNLFRPFVGGEGSVTVMDLFRHMDHILNAGGEDTLVFGCDFDGCDGRFPDKISGIESMQYIREQMSAAGFSDEIIEKIFFENGYQFIKRNVR